MKLSTLFTREASNTAQVFQIPHPVTGKPTGEVIGLLGTDSDIFQAAALEHAREQARILSLPEAKQGAEKEKAFAVLFFALFDSWSLEDDLTPENVQALIKECPYLKRGIDNFAADRANFIKLPSEI